MKSPPEQYTDDIARTKVEDFIVGADHLGQPDERREPAVLSI